MKQIILTLYDEVSTREKSLVMDKMEVMEDDERNPNFEGLEDWLEWGHSYRVTIEDLGPERTLSESEKFFNERGLVVSYGGRLVQILKRHEIGYGYELVAQYNWDSDNRPAGMSVSNYANQLAYESYREAHQ